MLIKNINSSLLRFCAVFANQHPGMEVVNFDAHGDEQSLPQADVVGISGVSVSVDEGLCDVTLMIGISTREDTNLFRLNEYIDKLFHVLLPTKKMRLYDADSGSALGWLVTTNGTRTLAIGGSSTRPLQYIMVTLVSTVTFS